MSTKMRKKYPPVEIGNVYGRLTVVGEAGTIVKNGISVRMVKCICSCDASVTVDVPANDLKYGHRKSCGCWRTNPDVKDDLIGKQFTRLTVRELDESRKYSNNGKKRLRYYICDCVCGNTVSVCSSDLRSGGVKSCGCLARETSASEACHKINDLTGKTFGEVTVIKRVESYVNYDNNGNKYTQSRYLVRCNHCGKEFITYYNALTTGRTKSCGCMHSSHGEEAIRKILEQYNLNYKSEYWFDDLRGPNNGYLRYDFCLLDDNNEVELLIEYDGIQHYQESKLYDPLENIQHRDRLKNAYCLDHNIPLIRLPAIDPDSITIEDLSLNTTQYLVTSVDQYQDQDLDKVTA